MQFPNLIVLWKEELAVDKKPTRIKDVLENLDASFDAAFEVDTNERERFLRELGYDEKKIADGTNFIQRLLAQRRLGNARKLREMFNNIIESHKSTFETVSGLKAKEAFEKIVQAGDSQRVQLAFREFQEATDDDIKSMLQDTEILNLLKDFMKESNNQ